jgi:hypothetical protein
MRLYKRLSVGWMDGWSSKCFKMGFFPAVYGRIDLKFDRDLQVDLHFLFFLFFLLSSFPNSSFFPLQNNSRPGVGRPQGEFNLLVIKILISPCGRSTLGLVGHLQGAEPEGMVTPRNTLHWGFMDPQDPVPVITPRPRLHRAYHSSGLFHHGLKHFNFETKLLTRNSKNMTNSEIEDTCSRPQT